VNDSKVVGGGRASMMLCFGEDEWPNMLRTNGAVGGVVYFLNWGERN
jgi:hypothetical protein